MMQIISLPAIFALHTLFPNTSEWVGTSHDKNHVPFLGQPKVLYPEHSPHLLSQLPRPFKFLEIVLNHSGTTCNPFIKGIYLLSDVLDALNLIPAQAFHSADLFVQPLQLSLMSCSLSHQVLSDVVVAPRCGRRLRVVSGLGAAIHNFFDLTHTRRVQTRGFEIGTLKQAHRIHLSCDFRHCAPRDYITSTKQPTRR